MGCLDAFSFFSANHRPTSPLEESIPLPCITESLDERSPLLPMIVVAEEVPQTVEPTVDTQCTRDERGWWSCESENNICFFNPCGFLAATFCVASTTYCCGATCWLMAGLMTAQQSPAACTYFGSLITASATNNPQLNTACLGLGITLGLSLTGQCCCPDDRQSPSMCFSPCYCEPRRH